MRSNKRIDERPFNRLSITPLKYIIIILIIVNLTLKTR